MAPRADGARFKNGRFGRASSELAETRGGGVAASARAKGGHGRSFHPTALAERVGDLLATPLRNRANIRIKVSVPITTYSRSRVAGRNMLCS